MDATTLDERPVAAVVFDVGGVLLDWSPHYLYRSLIPDDAARERFLAEVCTPDWNRAQDAGRPWSEAVRELSASFPEHAELIAAFDARWEETVAGPFEATVAVLAELRERQVPTYALTNFSAEKWAIVCDRWDFLRGFSGCVVSGEEGVVKPDAKIYERLLDRFELDPARTFFTDDVADNVDGARAVGLQAEVFVDAVTLRGQLVRRGVLDR